MKSFTVVLFLVLIYPSGRGQIPWQVPRKTIDSLFMALGTSEGIERADILNALSLNLADRNFDSSFYFAGKALSLSRSLGYSRGEGLALYARGNAFFVAFDLKNALESYYDALRILEQYEPSEEVGDLTLMIAKIKRFIGDSPRSDLAFRRALNNYTATGDSVKMMRTFVNMIDDYINGILFRDSLYEVSQTLTDSVFTMNETWLKYVKNHPEVKGSGIGLANIKAFIMIYERDTNVLAILHRNIELARILERSYPGTLATNLGAINGNLSQVYKTVLHDRKTAEVYLLKDWDGIRGLAGDYDLKVNVLLELGRFKIHDGMYDAALRYLHAAGKCCDTLLNDERKQKLIPVNERIRYIRDMLGQQVEIDSLLYTIYAGKGDFRQAYYYQGLYVTHRNSIAQARLRQAFELSEVNYLNNKTESQIISLKHENDLREVRLSRTRFAFALTGAFILLLVISAFYYFRRRRNLAEIKALEMEQKLLRSQMNPHFIFNSLASIQNSIVNENPHQANIYLSKFSKLIRNILDNSVEETVPLAKEVETIRNYLELQKIRYAGKFDFSIYLDPALDPEETFIPPMLAQPFIENSVEHGIRHRTTPGHISIRFITEGKILRVVIEDNGVGREKAREFEMNRTEKHRSMATSITTERLKSINKKQKGKIVLEITDLKDGRGEVTGTRVMFEIPPL